MENLYPCKIVFSLHLLFFHFLSLSVGSSSYTLPNKYFINCGSDTSVLVNDRNFIGDEKPGPLSISFGRSTSPVKETGSSTGAPSLYQTARIFEHQSWYKFDIAQNGTYVVRLHFFPFSYPNNLFDARFNVSTSGVLLLSNFGVQNNSNSPLIKEFLLTVNVGEFKIFFTPAEESSLAFVNAIEAFLGPESFVPDSAAHVTHTGSNSNYSGWLSHVLHLIHRINVGGEALSPDEDKLGRSWLPDDDYLISKDAAKNSPIYSETLKYQDGRATEYTAPNSVYKTAKEANMANVAMENFPNITWSFNVTKNAKHFVRLHFCDVVSDSENTIMEFSLYIYGESNQSIKPLSIGVPFYTDLVVDSDNSGFMNISISPLHTFSPNAFLNGLEIMKLMPNLSSPMTRESVESTKKPLVIIIGPVVGGVAFVIILMVVFFITLKCRKTKPVESSDWPLVPPYDGNSYTRVAGLTGSFSPASLHLGLKVPFAEILHATKNFDPKLMIGEGGFGKVYKGTCRNGMKVAVKRSEPGNGQGLPEFQTEILVLSNIRHRHLVSLIGYCDERSEMILVYEFMEKGTLRDHLYGSNEHSKKTSSRAELSWSQRLEICIGAAKGLNYLHTGSDGTIIHRDVKSTNILLDQNYVAKVSDFGLSRSGPSDQYISTEVKGSFGYLDPEYCTSLQLTQKSDVYSFGVVLLEVLCARAAINSTLPREQVILAEWGISCQKKGQLDKIIDPLLVGQINPNSLRKFGETVEKCLKGYGIDRPDMIDVVWDLEYALQLQRSAVPREPHEDSTTDVSWELSLPVIHRLPSVSASINEEDMALGAHDSLELSNINASEMFSQLRITDAR